MCFLTSTLWWLAALLTASATPIDDVDQFGEGWTRLPSITRGPRQEHAVVASGNAIWILGGNSPDAVEYYSPTDGGWHTASPMISPLNHLNAAAVGDEIFVLGGLSAGDEWLAQDISMVYSPSSNSWQPRSPLPAGTARGACAVGVYRNKIYLAGGMTYLEATQDALTTVTSYDVTSDSWDLNLPLLPRPRQHVAGVVVGSTFYVLGGREDGQLKVQNTVYALDLESPGFGWKEMASMPTPRGGLACAAVQQNIYCFGGEGNPNAASGVFDQVEVYDTTRNTWANLNPMPVPRHGWGVATVGNTIFVPGGGVQEGTAPTDYFDSFTP
ncbi:Putative galactose oxidase/kelch, beta-propeller, kelch-type beta propeller [Septoria linicola]|uniref:Galactose oxidase/kelch, beta-propeller, kelch-type beta propeller n=1 Tax=Septoria linicola TaxID=215465 RepID=A0A9Q9EQ52_9PEZI|nr:putative galactose oxidase/kelch, beta-propeller, kelch-type beta propeller [Septoria linicola]USW59461.1 Putative galactose oxidase/kelch, beta-propeller, kelch-type beta propeller [Septoria linicola]